MEKHHSWHVSLVRTSILNVSRTSNQKIEKSFPSKLWWTYQNLQAGVGKLSLDWILAQISNQSWPRKFWNQTDLNRNSVWFIGFGKKKPVWYRFWRIQNGKNVGLAKYYPKTVFDIILNFSPKLETISVIFRVLLIVSQSNWNIGFLSLKHFNYILKNTLILKLLSFVYNVSVVGTPNNFIFSNYY